MSELKLPHGITVRTFTPPPEGFDPLTADDRSLAVHGYPSRPADPELRARWERVLGRGIRLVPPEFTPREGRRRAERPALGGDHGVENTSIWSGAVVHAPAGDTVKWVEGTWTVPNAYPPVGAQDGQWYSASTWVGIDGIDGSGDVLQAGCDSDVLRSGGSVQRQLNPWWEWYPAGSFWIHNLAMSQGDTVNCLICVTAGSTVAATVFLYNVTSGIATNFQATAPGGTHLVGNAAEWVVERLSISSAGALLARYGEVYFDEANAGTVGGSTLHSGSGNTINMVDGGNVISAGTLENATLVQVKYTGANH